VHFDEELRPKVVDQDGVDELDARVVVDAHLFFGGFINFLRVYELFLRFWHIF
jgi:hypothetical protein